MAAEAIRAGLPKVQAPQAHQKVYKDEAVLTFDTPYREGGLYVSLSPPWQSFGPRHVVADSQRTGNTLYLHQKWTKVLLPETEEDAPTKLAIGVEGGFAAEPKTETIKHHELAVVVGDKVEHIPLDADAVPMMAKMACDAIIAHEGQTVRDEIAAWEVEEAKPSKYADSLEQLPDAPKISPDPSQWVCAESGATTNLWLNLSTGHIGSGRRQLDGSGGTGAALKHYEDTGRKYPLVVKLGTITAQGADVYSYAPDEDCAVLDPHLAKHLQHFGINIMELQKTEKTTTELELEMNKKGWDSLDAGGKEEKFSGPGRQGLWNLGNSCYMNSVLQTLFAMPELQIRYGVPAQEKVMSQVPAQPADDLVTQIAKVGNVLGSGEFAPPPEAEGSPRSRKLFDPAYEVRPLMFKTLVGRGHPEFSSGRQQDAMEYLRHLLELLRRAERTAAPRIGGPPEVATEQLFKFELEHRTQCNESATVAYKGEPYLALQMRIPLEAATNRAEYEAAQERAAKLRRLNEERKARGEKEEPKEDPVVAQVPFDACLHKLTDPQTIQDFASPALGGKKTTATRQTRFRTFPRYLCIEMMRYYADERWMPQKMQVAVPMPEELDLTALRSSGLQPGETEMPKEEPKAAAKPEPDPAIVAQLMGMGFGENGCKKACLATKNSGVEAAMEWVMQHMGDDNFNDPVPQEAPSGGGGGGGHADPEAVSMLSSLGFSERQAKAALQACNGSQERAADWLFTRADDLDAAVAEVEGSAAAPAAAGGGAGALDDGPGKYSLLAVILHQGSHTGSGHYVADIKKDGRWIRFNDDRVYAPEGGPGLDKGYIYVYRRDESTPWQ
eukprot:TRINITY_DN4141_c4_g1_i1.p1 TRINITY_DN4141_c4_g1~~TRINITY_DN4141_c4_g1_i1.p1  ORF type:complete len:868 (+),score=375.79 TRINITY_DN4141_c4_g1_i1:93-2606(+)